VAALLQRKYPGIRVEGDRIFVKQGSIWTSAGVTAGIDLALALIEEDFGQEMAKTVAQDLVVYYRRPGGQSQFSALLELEARSERISVR
jgi:transcriptional regulator GlxA family with amidase domain